MKVKFPVGDKVREVKGDQCTAQKCYVEAIRGNSEKMEVDPPNKEIIKALPSRMTRKVSFPLMFNQLKSY
ncbi:UNVERIFIED_CONTAM: hypothetical protein Sradi_5703300 [Sesamum radiatum]|uniref:Uncharacterized protein n=1 Tax=Sesamum radiatum TaxID=300843 RepID=A0AAW2L1D0_SESRA